MPYSKPSLVSALLPVAALLVGALAAPAAPVPPAAPVQRYDFPVQRYDFGAVQAGGVPVMHTFRITDTRKTPITLGQITTACRCTSASVDGPNAMLPLMLKPGQSISVHVSVDTRLLAPGQADKYVYLRLQGESLPAYTLEMTGIVRPLAAGNQPAASPLAQQPRKR